MNKKATTKTTNNDRRAASKSLDLCGFGDVVLLSILSLSKATFVACHGVVGLALLCLSLIFVVAAFYGVRAMIEQTAPIRSFCSGDFYSGVDFLLAELKTIFQ